MTLLTTQKVPTLNAFLFILVFYSEIFMIQTSIKKSMLLLAVLSLTHTIHGLVSQPIATASATIGTTALVYSFAHQVLLYGRNIGKNMVYPAMILDPHNGKTAEKYEADKKIAEDKACDHGLAAVICGAIALPLLGLAAGTTDNFAITLGFLAGSFMANAATISPMKVKPTKKHLIVRRNIAYVITAMSAVVFGAQFRK